MATHPAKHEVARRPRPDPARGGGAIASAGHNELPAPPRRTILRIVAGVATEPMFLMIVAAGALYLVLGDVGEALLLLAFIVIVIGITIVQERKTERVLDALRDLSSPRARVIRDGGAMVVPGRDVVPGDILLLDEGDRVAADARAARGARPVRRRVAADRRVGAGDQARGWQEPIDAERSTAAPRRRRRCRWSSRARWSCRAAASRASSPPASTPRWAGSASALAAVEEPESPLQRETRELVRRVAIVAVVLSIAAAALYWATRGDPLEAVLAGLALAMSMLPEEFPVIFTVFMAAGAWRISRRHVLTRRIDA